MLTSRLLFAALTLLSLTSLLPTCLSQTGTATPPGSDPSPPEIPGSPTDRTGSGYTPSASQIDQLNSITNFVIVPFGAQSFDSIMGTFPGANGIDRCMAEGTCPPQKDANGNTYQYLPGFTDSTSKVTVPGGVLPNRPYDIMQYLNVSLSTVIGNPSHSYFQQKFKYNGGKMDGFVAYGGSNAGISMGYYNLSKWAPNNGIFALAKSYTLFDRFHAASFGDSVAQHLYFVGGTTYPWDSTMPGQCPADIVLQFNTTLFPQTFTNGSGTYMTSWTQQPPLNRQCYFIGELNSQNLCSGNPPFLPEIPNSPTNPKQVGDVFDRYNQSWAWYAEDFVAAEAADCMQPGPRQFNVHDQPWQHYTTFHLNNSAYWQTHQKDSSQFWTALAAQNLEALTWYLPSQVEDFGWSNNSPAAGNAFVDGFVANITNSALWKAGKLAVIYTWVGPSGLQDHVAPPRGDQYGPGGRVATIFMSPFHTSSNKAINSDVYEHYSIYKMIARRFNMDMSILQGIWGNTRYMAAADLTMSFPGGGSGGNGASAVSVASGVVVLVLSVLALLL